MTRNEKIVCYIQQGLNNSDIAQMLVDGGEAYSHRTLRRFAADVRAEIKGGVEQYQETLDKIKTYSPYIPVIQGEERVLVIGDLHAPFTHEDYLEFCMYLYGKYECNRVIFIGDIIDNHYSSYHETDPDGFGGGEELDRAIAMVQDWVEAFPIADVCIGNHDAIIMRKAFSSGIPKAWIKSYADILGSPDWNFVDSVTYNGVRYSHGHKTGKATVSYKRDLISTVSGHYHSAAGIDYHVGLNHRIFGMQVGSGVDDTSYALSYGAGSKKSIMGAGVVLEDGKLPIFEPMELGNILTDEKRKHY
jgi:hypothetical protein